MSLVSPGVVYLNELAGIDATLRWFRNSSFRHMVIHSDSQSAIQRATHTGPGPTARSIERILRHLPENRTAQLLWVKGHSGVPGNERADSLAGEAANRTSHGHTSVAYPKSRISELYSHSKAKWTLEADRGTDAIPRPKKSCLDRARDGLARTATQIRSGHWRSAVYLHRIRKHPNDRCWFCFTGSKMSRSHALLHCPNPRLAAARTEAWGSNKPSGVRALLSNPRWERRLLIFLERSGVSRVVTGDRDPDAVWADKRDRWIIWEGREQRSE